MVGVHRDVRGRGGVGVVVRVHRDVMGWWESIGMLGVVGVHRDIRSGMGWWESLGVG